MVRRHINNITNTGNFEEFVECLIDVVKNSKRGEITRIANGVGINRSNLYDIMNGKVTPRELAEKLKFFSQSP